MEAVCAKHGKGNIFSWAGTWKVWSKLWLHGQRQDPMDGQATSQRNLGPLRPCGKEPTTALDHLSFWTVIWERKELPFYLSHCIYESRCYSSLARTLIRIPLLSVSVSFHSVLHHSVVIPSLPSHFFLFFSSPHFYGQYFFSLLPTLRTSSLSSTPLFSLESSWG